MPALVTKTSFLHILVPVLAVACGIPRSPDSIESRCTVGFDSLEAQECRGDLRGRNPALLQFQLEQFKTQCTDPTSVARIEKIKTTCMAAQQAAVREVKDERRAIRAKYIAEVSALLIDPAYAPMVDRYRDLEELAFHGDRVAKLEANEVLAQLQGLAQKHGIDPRHGKVLQLW
ncbi:MAG: hypothetical protein K0S65_2155 [Labilithrix sp.]|nr:hypothetical protein [Labilithrix sp.]